MPAMSSADAVCLVWSWLTYRAYDWLWMNVLLDPMPPPS